MAGLWSNPSEFPRLPDEEEIGGEMNLVGPGGSSGCGVDEDTGMFACNGVKNPQQRSQKP